jgi:hypothetical protein
MEDASFFHGRNPLLPLDLLPWKAFKIKVLEVSNAA